jgi:hypothetical protein
MSTRNDVKTQSVPFEPKHYRLHLVAMILYLGAILIMSWCYFVVPAPERWRYVKVSFANWVALFRP